VRSEYIFSSFLLFLHLPLRNNIWCLKYNVHLPTVMPYNSPSLLVWQIVFHCQFAPFCLSVFLPYLSIRRLNNLTITILPLYLSDKLFFTVSLLPSSYLFFFPICPLEGSTISCPPTFALYHFLSHTQKNLDIFILIS
jgi:hypothetical protein